MEEVDKEQIHVTMHILARHKAEVLAADKDLHLRVDTAMRMLMQPIRSGKELAARLALPAEVPIEWQVKVFALPEDFKSQQGHIPIMISVEGVPNLMERLRPEVMEEITNIIFKEIRNTHASRDLATALGYETEKPLKFHIYLPHQIRVRGPAEHAGGDGDDGDGWGKGCNSWPW
jgi:hypothetical protein